MTYTKDLQAGIRHYLDQVSASLSATPADERTEVIQYLESHIHEALKKRSADNPTMDDMKAILEQMGTPESYLEDNLKDVKNELDSYLRKRSFHLLLRNIICTSLFLYIVIITRKGYSEIFMSLDAPLPLPTHFIVNVPSTWVILFGLVVIGSLILLEIKTKNKKRTMAIYHSYTLIGIGILVVGYLIAMFLPLIDVIRMVGSS